MPDLLLKTKLSNPIIRKDLVARPRLINELNADLWQANGFARKLTLVCAPAGFGKTTLVADWLGNIGQRAVWLSLDEGDNDPARFLAARSITSRSSRISAPPFDGRGKTPRG